VRVEDDATVSLHAGVVVFELQGSKLAVLLKDAPVLEVLHAVAGAQRTQGSAELLPERIGKGCAQQGVGKWLACELVEEVSGLSCPRTWSAAVGVASVVAEVLAAGSAQRATAGVADEIRWLADDSDVFQGEFLHAYEPAG
jgi:hypothetical protein